MSDVSSVPGGGAPDDAWAVGDALGYGWKKFQENLGQILLAALILVVALGIGIAITVGIRAALLTTGACAFNDKGTYVCDGGSGFLLGQLANSLGQLVVTILGMIVSAALLRGALDVTEGRPFQVTGLVERINVVNVVLASLLVSVITFVGTLLCFVPGIIAGFLLLFTPFFVIDKGLAPVEAVRASFDFTRQHLGDMLVWVVVGSLVYVVGICLCGVGLLVTAPVVLIGAAYTYKRLQGLPVAP